MVLFLDYGSFGSINFQNMLHKFTQNHSKIFFLAILCILLTMVRVFETELFYDPFLIFFKAEFNSSPLPEFDNFKLFASLLFRYLLNTILSILIIYVCFKDKEMLQFTILLYGIFFVILIIIFYYLILNATNLNNLAIFYVRRFLIQPIFVLLFVPAFYYQKNFAKN